MRKVNSDGTRGAFVEVLSCLESIVTPPGRFFSDTRCTGESFAGCRALGRAAAHLSLDGDLAPAQLDLANWIIQKYAFSAEELATLQWPSQIEELGEEPNGERLAEAVASGRLGVPDAWKDELTSP